MLLKILTPKSSSQLKVMLDKHDNILAFGSQTSTVIPFNRPEVIATLGFTSLVDLSCMPKQIIMIHEELVRVDGAVSWLELREFLNEKNLEFGCSPTDETALVLSGLATSATGERCFKYGTLRDQCESLTFLNENLEEVILTNKPINDPHLSQYQVDFESKYSSFKNGPYPRLKNEVDFMIGMEGQLGIILSATIRVFKKLNTSFILLPVPSFKEKDHLVKIVKALRLMKDQVASLEFFDVNSLSFSRDQVLEESDYVAIEVIDNLEGLVVEKLENLKIDLNFEKAFFLSKDKFSKLRVSIPRGVNEYLSQNKMLKLGTDAQVGIEDFDKLLGFYEKWTNLGIKYVLFGHLGDCHLHFNFLPKEDQIDKCQELLLSFYKDLSKINASPFAEHGIGVIKKKFMGSFYNDEVRSVFQYLIKKFNSSGRFYNKGFLNNG